MSDRESDTEKRRCCHLGPSVYPRKMEDPPCIWAEVCPDKNMISYESKFMLGLHEVTKHTDMGYEDATPTTANPFPLISYVDHGLSI